MAQTYGGYAFKTGSTPSETLDAGFVVLSQQITLQAAGTGAASNVDGSLVLPPGSQILNIVPDTTVAHTSGTAALTVGSAAGGAQYVASTDIKAKGRVAITPSALVDAWQDVGTNVILYFRLALASTSTAVGTTMVTITYIQKR